MSLTRAGVSGIGTAGGFAWPLFGLLMATLGALAGGALAIILGSISAGLFIGCFSLVSYFVYRNYQKEEAKLSEKLNKQGAALIDQLNLFFSQAQHQYQHICEQNEKFDMDFASYIRHCIIDKSQKSREEVFLLELILSQLSSDKKHWILFLNLNAQERRKYLRHSLEECSILQLQSETYEKITPSSLKFTIGFLAFVGTFGSTAGFAAGFTGLLMGLGVFAGLGSFPIIALSILIFSVITSLAVAQHSIHAAVEQTKRKNLCKEYKNLTRDLQENKEEPLEDILQTQKQENITPSQSQTFARKSPMATTHNRRSVDKELHQSFHPS